MTQLKTIVNDGNVVVEPTISTPTKPSVNGHAERSKSRSHVLHRSLHDEPHRVLSAKGHTLYLDNGQQIFDATGGAAVSCLGHGDER